MNEEKELTESFQRCFENVFRAGTTQPGFCLLDLGQDLDSFRLREVMVEIKNYLSTRTQNSFNKVLTYQWLVRFDQQANTKYHLDNASNQSFLMLGYEPTEIESELIIADYVKFSHDHGIAPADYFETYNPLFTDQEEILKPYVTKVQPFKKESFKIVLINNSNCQPESDTLGVLHKARMINRDLDKPRVVNSMMLNMVSEKNATGQLDLEQTFLNTEHVSK